MELWLIIFIGSLALLMGFLNTSFGMGYGMITPILLILGFAPTEVIPVILLNSGILGIAVSCVHILSDEEQLQLDGNWLNTGTYLALFGVIGVTLGAFTAVTSEQTLLKILIGVIVIFTGINAFRRTPKTFESWIETMTFGLVSLQPPRFSWKKMTLLGITSSFSKGVSGGGYGSIITAGQIMHGTRPRQAVAATIFADAMISITGFIIFVLLKGSLNIRLDILLPTLIGGATAIPISLYTVYQLKSTTVKNIIAVFSILIGVILIASTLFAYLR